MIAVMMRCETQLPYLIILLLHDFTDLTLTLLLLTTTCIVFCTKQGSDDSMTSARLPELLKMYISIAIGSPADEARKQALESQKTTPDVARRYPSFEKQPRRLSHRQLR